MEQPYLALVPSHRPELGGGKGRGKKARKRGGELSGGQDGGEGRKKAEKKEEKGEEMKGKGRREDRAGRRREAGEERREAARQRGKGRDAAPRGQCASWPRRWPPCWPRPRPQVSGTAGAQRNVAAPLGRRRDPGLRLGLPPAPSGAEQGAGHLCRRLRQRGRGWGSGSEPRRGRGSGSRRGGLARGQGRIRPAASPPPRNPAAGRVLPRPVVDPLPPLLPPFRVPGSGVSAQRPDPQLGFKKQTPSDAEVYGNASSGSFCARRDNVELHRGTAGEAEAKGDVALFSTGA